MAGSPPTGFLDIPLELRHQIYQHCLARPSPITVNYLWNDILPGDRSGRHQKSLLLVCRKISEEALGVLYGDNVFRVDLNPGGGLCLRKNFTAVNRMRSKSMGASWLWSNFLGTIAHLKIVRKLQIVIHDYDQSHDSLLHRPDLWPPILFSLSSLLIIAKQPLASDPIQGVASMEDWLKDWISWVEPMLKFISKQLSSDVVHVDCDGREEIIALMRVSFEGCREVRTRAGDWIFRRGSCFEEYKRRVKELRRDAEDESDDD
jgi:hypothetical protein